MTQPLPPAPLAEALATLNRGASPTAAIQWLDAHATPTYRVDRFALGNGLEIVLWPDHTAPVAAWHTWFRVGSRHDPAGRTGLAHLFEHMMFKATTTRPEGEYDRIMEGLGAQTNASTWVDWTNYHAKVTAWDLETVCTLEADRMANLAIDADMLEREREVVANERIMRVDDDPDGQLAEKLYRELFDDHPYGLPTIGWMEDIRAITLDDCFRFYRNHYAPSNAVIVVCGDFEPEAVLGLIQSHYGAMEAIARPEEAPLPPVLPSEAPARDVTCEAPVQAGRIVWAWRGPGSASAEHAALHVATEILSGSDSARLVMRLVEEEEVATDVSAWVNPWGLGSAVEIGVTLRPGADPERAAALLREELATFLEGGPTPDELERTRNGLETDFWRGLADVNARANQLGHAHVTLGDYRDLWAEAERLASVRHEDVVAACRRWLAPDAVTRGHLVPLGDGGEPGDDADDGDEGEDEA